MLLWLARRAWNLFCIPQGDCLGQPGTFFSCDFGLPRTGSSSAVHSRSLDSLHSSSGTSSSSAWALSFELEWAEASRTFWPHTIYIYIYILWGRKIWQAWPVPFQAQGPRRGGRSARGRMKGIQTARMHCRGWPYPRQAKITGEEDATSPEAVFSRIPKEISNPMGQP